jgi:hypothetical protein
MTNPWLAVLSILGITRESQGAAGTLYLVCSACGAAYGGSFSGNPFSEVKRLLLAAGDRSLGYQTVEGTLTAGELRYATR